MGCQLGSLAGSHHDNVLRGHPRKPAARAQGGAFALLEPWSFFQGLGQPEL